MTKIIIVTLEVEGSYEDIQGCLKDLKDVVQDLLPRLGVKVLGKVEAHIQ